MLRNLLIALALLLFSFVPASSRGITNGTVEVPPSHGFVFVVMNLSGANFEVAGGGSNLLGIGFAPCLGLGQPCTAGQVVNLSVVSGQWDFSDVFGSMTIDGTQYFFVNQLFPKLPAIAGGGDMGFTGEPVMIPFGNAPTITLRARFSASGVLTGRASGVLFGPVLGLSGSGIATAALTLDDFGSEPTYRLHGLIYKFGPQVNVDIKPGDNANLINLRSRGKLPVAILSTAAFDATAINPFRVTVAGAPVSLKPNGTPMSSLEDVNSDGLLDLVIHVSTAALQPNFDNECLLEGTTFAGQYFFGTDTIAAVP